MNQATKNPHTLAQTGPCEFDYEMVKETIQELRMDTCACAFSLKEKLCAPVITADNVKFAAIGWVTKAGAFAACAKLAVAIRRDGQREPILDVYRVARFDLEMHAADTHMVADAYAALITKETCPYKVVYRDEDRWRMARFANPQDQSRRFKDITTENLGLQLQSYQGGNVVFLGARPIFRRLCFGFINVVLPWSE